jgi:KUP system potassium uptake protein
MIGRFFGPVSLVWFVTLAAGGLYGIAREPAILAAINPLHALRFLTGHGFASFVVLGAVVLAFTGAEALYADMGHFGKRPVRIAWFSIVGPALVLNYFGQGALLMARPETVSNPFFNLYPSWALYPMVALATLASVIAAQAVITGAFSLTRQAIQLGFLPRINIVHTSAREIGQIYIPAVNWVLCASVVTVVVQFGSSSALAGAYGVAVTATMLVDTILTFFVIRYGWRYPLWLCLFATGFFLMVDVSLLSATLLKVFEGGWFPLAIGAVVFAIMTTWRRGRQVLYEHLNTSSVPLGQFLDLLFKEPPHRIPGTAVFLTATPDATPHALLHNLNHNKVLHERVVFLTVEVRDVPWVAFSERVTVDSLGNGCWRVSLRYGFMNRPDVTRALELCGALGLEFEMMETSFFLSRQLIVPREGGIAPMARWRERMFAAMARNAGNITDYFNIPPNRVIELGTRVHI